MKRRGRRDGGSFSCGHPRTAENTRVASGRGYRWGRCRICNNAYMREYMRNRKRRFLQSRLARAEAKLRRLSAAARLAGPEPPHASGGTQGA